MEGLDYLGVAVLPSRSSVAKAPISRTVAKQPAPSPAAVAKAKALAARANNAGSRAIAAGRKLLASANKRKNAGAVKLANAIIARGKKAQSLAHSAPSAIVGQGGISDYNSGGGGLSPDAQQYNASQMILNLTGAAVDAEQGTDIATAATAALDEGQYALDLGNRALALGKTAVAKGFANDGNAAVTAGQSAIAAGQAAQSAAANPPPDPTPPDSVDQPSPQGADQISTLNTQATLAHAAGVAALNAALVAENDTGKSAGSFVPGQGTGQGPMAPVSAQSLLAAAQGALSQVQFAEQAATAQQNQVAYSQLQTLAQQLSADIAAGQPFLANPSAAGAQSWATQIATDTNNATSALVMLQQGGMGVPAPTGGYGGGDSGGGYGGSDAGGGDDDSGDAEQQVADEDEASRGGDFIPPDADSDAPDDFSDGNMSDDEQQALDDADMMGADFDWLSLASGAAGAFSSFGGGAPSGNSVPKQSESDKLAALLAKQKADEDLRRAQSTTKAVVGGAIVLALGAVAYVLSKRGRK